MLRRQRVVRLLTACVVAAEGVGPDEVLCVLHAKPLWGVVGVGHHVLAAQPLASAYAVSGHPSLILDVLEVVRGLVAVLVLHPRDGALADLADGLHSAGGAHHLRLFWVELLGHAVVADDLLTLGHRLHQRVVAPVLDVHAEALQQLVGVARERDFADDQERVAVVLVGDVGARLLRPLHVVEPVLQLPTLQPGVLEVRVADVIHCPRLLIQCVFAVGTHDDVELMACTTCISDGGPVDGGHVVRDSVILAGNEVSGVACILQLCPSLEDGFYLLLVACSRCQRVQCDCAHNFIFVLIQENSDSALQTNWHSYLHTHILHR